MMPMIIFNPLQPSSPCFFCLFLSPSHTYISVSESSRDRRAVWPLPGRQGRERTFNKQDRAEKGTQWGQMQGRPGEQRGSFACKHEWAKMQKLLYLVKAPADGHWITGQGRMQAVGVKRVGEGESKRQRCR